jgi:hypothetical protein
VADEPGFAAGELIPLLPEIPRNWIRSRLPAASWRSFYNGVSIVVLPEDEELRIDLRPGAVNDARNMTATEVIQRVAAHGTELASMIDIDAIRESLHQQFISTMLYGTGILYDPAQCQAAETRAEALLRTWLAPQQIEELDQHDYFHVVGSDSGKTYRIHRGTVQNVIELGADGAPVIGRCFAPAGELAAADVMLGQKIALETQETKAIKKSNLFHVVGVPHFNHVVYLDEPSIEPSIMIAPLHRPGINQPNVPAAPAFEPAPARAEFPRGWL